LPFWSRSAKLVAFDNPDGVFRQQNPVLVTLSTEPLVLFSGLPTRLRPSTVVALPYVTDVVTVTMVAMCFQLRKRLVRPLALN
jgi:hypothetical protein